MRPRRLSVEVGSELERTLAQELLGMSRAADRFMGEEETEQEVNQQRFISFQCQMVLPIAAKKPQQCPAEPSQYFSRATSGFESP